MSSTNHTPGLCIYDSGVFYAACQMDENGMTYENPIAQMLEGRPFESRGNANLILAAPDLLEACEAALENDEISEGFGARNMEEDLRNQLRAAIAKARGREFI